MHVPNLDKLNVGVFFVDDVVIFCENIAKIKRALQVLEEWITKRELMSRMWNCDLFL